MTFLIPMPSRSSSRTGLPSVPSSRSCTIIPATTSGSCGSGRVWPFPEYALGEFEKARCFLVPEINLGQIAREIERHTKVPVTSLPKLGGELHTPAELLAALEAYR